MRILKNQKSVAWIGAPADDAMPKLEFEDALALVCDDPLRKCDVAIGLIKTQSGQWVGVGAPILIERSDGFFDPEDPCIKAQVAELTEPVIRAFAALGVEEPISLHLAFEHSWNEGDRD